MGNNEIRVFISYAREDYETAKRLYKDLKAAGVTPWMDQENLFVGQNWKEGVRRAIGESDYFLALISSGAVEKKGYYQTELNKALNELQAHPPDKIYILPVRIEECTPKHEMLRDLNWADLFPSYADGLAKLIRVFESEQAKPSPAPAKTAPVTPKSDTANKIRDLEDRLMQLESMLTKSQGDTIHIHAGRDVAFAKDQAKVKTIRDELDSLRQEAEPLKTEVPKKPTKPAQTKPKYQLRSEPLTVSDNEFKTVFRLDKKQRPLEYIENDYEDNTDGTVTDHATGLMWQKSGSGRTSYTDIPAYVEKIKREKLGGYDDWRLPTIEELMSLLENEKKNGDLHIDPIFDKSQRWCWSSDKRAGGGVWSVSFFYGSVSWLNEYDGSNVRLVRRGQ